MLNYWSAYTMGDPDANTKLTSIVLYAPGAFYAMTSTMNIGSASSSL